MTIDIQREETETAAPSDEEFERCLALVLAEQDLVELCVRIVGEDEMTSLNNTYRQKNQPTNVLAFPFDSPQPPGATILGDIVICAPVVEREAKYKDLNEHWVHLLIHGVLHLLGYDHQTDEQADVMETKEAALMQALGFANPYEVNE